MTPFVVGLDQGTGSTKAVVLDATGEVVHRSAVHVGITHPMPGHCEQDPHEILASVGQALDEARRFAGDRPIAAVGLTNQRESALVWDRRTGEPLSPLIGWQDTRTADAVAGYDSDRAWVTARTGLPITPMFSALKLAWILDRIDPDRARARRGDIVAGTVDAWLVHRLTGRPSAEAGNASRTLLLSLEHCSWDDELLDLFGIPPTALPDVTRSDSDLGPVSALDGARLTAVLGDSHAALYGHGITAPGSAKATLGSGSSIMAVSGQCPVGAGAAGSETLAWLLDRPTYAHEGNILAAGTAVEWAARLLGCSADEVFRSAERCGDGSVDLVPAFGGLGAPWWDLDAVAVASGFGLGDGPDELCVAAVESIALQVIDVVDAVSATSHIDELRVDGGIAANGWFVQRLADLAQRPIRRPSETSLSAVGVALLAGRSSGVFDDGSAGAVEQAVTTFRPSVSTEIADRRRKRWHAAVARSRGVTS